MCATLQDDQGVVGGKPTTRVLCDQIVMIESQQASLTRNQAKLPEFHNALVAKALLLQETMKQVQRIGDAPVLRKASEIDVGFIRSNLEGALTSRIIVCAL